MGNRLGNELHHHRKADGFSAGYRFFRSMSGARLYHRDAVGTEDLF